MFKSYNFWIRLVAVLVLLLRIVGAEFGFDVDSGLIIDIATAVASVLVVLGVIQVPVQKVDYVSEEKISDDNKNGGKFMKTFEQVKNDLLIIKERIEENVAKENSVVGEISAIIESIICEKEEEEKVGDEEKIVVIEEGGDEEPIEELTSAEVKNDEGVHETKETAVSLELSEGEASSLCEGDGAVEELTEKLVGDAIFAVNEVMTEEEKAKVDTLKLDSIIREKIAGLVASEIDKMIEKASLTDA